jgi:hypothetical protein
MPESSETITYAYGDDARKNGVDITISLTPEEQAYLGADASNLADWIDSALWTLVMLRTGHIMRRPETPLATADDWYIAINDLGHRLIPRLEGIRDAAILAHAGAGGSVGQLASALDTARSTAQYRREALTSPDRLVTPTFERWAREGGPTTMARLQDQAGTES